MERFHERESSKRSWPWKKKSINDKVSAAPGDQGAASPIHSSRLLDDHQKWEYHRQEVPMLQYQPSPPRVVPKHLKEIKEAHDQEKLAHDRSRAALEEARIQWRQAEEKARAMNEKLTNALADITTKDNMVKQHVKVAEEAVTGWEKAEAEAVALKMQLDLTLQQKLATEDRVAHLDGALKECMKQLRHVREEQEQRIHDNLVKKTREYDKLRTDMEMKVAESNHFLNQTRNDLLESRAEVTALSHACQERSRSIVEMSEAKGKVETEIKVLQVRLETIEKENSHLKYEVHVLNKELEIRSEEREYERKAVDMASKQHLDSVKKIAKLEEECNRLRLLVRKKLPGPAAIQRMRMEVEGIGKDTADKTRRRALGRSASSWDSSGGALADENGHSSSTREAQLLAERVVAMDEEMKVLKDALAQRNGELQAARLMCSKTATRLSVVEDQLHRANQQQQNGANTSQKQASSEGGKAAEESARRDSLNFELMDDFALMERLAMTEALTESGIASQTISMSQEVDSKATEEQHEELAAKERELGEASALCEELKMKLADAETQIGALQSRNSANETSLINLQDQLGRLNVEHEKLVMSNTSQAGVQQLVKNVIQLQVPGADAGSKTSGESINASSSSSDRGVEVAPDQVSDAESKASTGHSELSIAVRKIVRIVEALAQAMTGSSDHRTLEVAGDAVGEIALQFEWENAGLDEMMRNLAHVSNRFLEGKYDLIDFVSELGTALDSILALKPPGKVVETDQLDRLKAEKAAIESRLAEATEQVERLKLVQVQVACQGTPFKGANHDQGDGESHKEEDMIEEELLQLSSPNPALRAASGELSKMQDKVAALERELSGERQRHESVVAQLTALQQQLRRGRAVSSEISGLSPGDFSSHSTSEDDDDDTKSLKQRREEAARKEEEERQLTAAAALAECQRTILALGKQLRGGGRATDHQQAKTTIENTEPPQRPAPSSLSMHNHTPSAIKDRAGTPAKRVAVRSPSPAHNSRISSSPGSSFSYHRQHSNSPQTAASDHGAKLQRSSSGVRGLQVRN